MTNRYQPSILDLRSCRTFALTLVLALNAGCGSDTGEERDSDLVSSTSDSTTEQPDASSLVESGTDASVPPTPSTSRGPTPSTSQGPTAPT
ncbi:MAG: hypothetical protein EA398_00190, partial [Deltaproteobacteria bacterium]